MDIYVLDGLNGTGDIVDSFQSVIWNMQFFGASDFELIVSGSPENIQKLQVGKLLVREVDLGNNEYHNIMLIESRELEFDIEEGWKLTLRGGGLKRILARRIVWNQTNLTGKVEKIIRQIITDNVISPAIAERAIPNFILDDEQGFSDEIQTEEADAQLSGENIAEWLESTCQSYGIGWDVYIKNGQYVFTLKKGTDRTYDQNTVIPVVFSPEYDNLITSTYTYDVSEYSNAALVAGEGEGTNQRITTVGTASGLDRFETYIDGSSVSSNGEIITLDTYMKMLTDYGNEQIKDTQFAEKFEGEILPNGMYDFNVDYFLGDLVQIENENGISAQTRITEAIYSEDENGSSLIPTFSDWEGDE